MTRTGWLGVEWRFAASSAAWGAGVLALCGLVFGPRDPAHLIVVALLGVFLGALIAPSLKPRAFRHPARFQTLCGALVGAGVAGLLGLGVEGKAFGILAGGLVGWLAPAWLRWVTLP